MKTFTNADRRFLFDSFLAGKRLSSMTADERVQLVKKVRQCQDIEVEDQQWLIRQFSVSEKFGTAD